MFSKPVEKRPKPNDQLLTNEELQVVRLAQNLPKPPQEVQLLIHHQSYPHPIFVQVIGGEIQPLGIFDSISMDESIKHRATHCALNVKQDAYFETTFYKVGEYSISHVVNSTLPCRPLYLPPLIDAVENGLIVLPPSLVQAGVHMDQNPLLIEDINNVIEQINVVIKRIELPPIRLLRLPTGKKIINDGVEVLSTEGMYKDPKAGVLFSLIGLNINLPQYGKEIVNLQQIHNIGHAKPILIAQSKSESPLPEFVKLCKLIDGLDIPGANDLDRKEYDPIVDLLNVILCENNHRLINKDASYNAAFPEKQIVRSRYLGELLASADLIVKKHDKCSSIYNYASWLQRNFKKDANLINAFKTAFQSHCHHNNNSVYGWTNWHTEHKKTSELGLIMSMEEQNSFAKKFNEFVVTPFNQQRLQVDEDASTVPLMGYLTEAPTKSTIIDEALAFLLPDAANGRKMKPFMEQVRIYNNRKISPYANKSSVVKPNVVTTTTTTTKRRIIGSESDDDQ